MNNLLKNKKLLAIIGAGVVVVIAIIVLLVVLLSGAGPKGVAEKYLKGRLQGEFDKWEDLYPAEYWEYMEKESDMSVEDVIKNREESWKDTDKSNKDDYGKDYKVSYEILKVKEWDKDDVKDYIDDAEENLEQYGIDEKDVKAVATVYYRAAYEGSEDNEDYYAAIDVVQIGGDWYYDFL